MYFITTIYILQSYSLEGKGLFVRVSCLLTCVCFNDDILIKNTEKDCVVRKIVERP